MSLLHALKLSLTRFFFASKSVAIRCVKAFRFKSPIWRWCLLVLVICTVALAVYCVKLNGIVVAKFEGQRFTVPSRIFARPLELFAGKRWDKEHLLTELRLLNFQSVEKVQRPGQYADHGDYVVFHSRDFRFWDGAQTGKMVRLTFANGFVSTLQDHTTGRDLPGFRLEPLAFSGSSNRDHEDRNLVKFDDIPKSLVEALIATEDRRFYQHFGVDLRSLMRAVFATLSGKGVQGGSTLTQQLVKNFYLTPERTIKRKINEMLMAIILDWRYDKNLILETYLNEVFFGQDGSRAIHGVRLAGQFFFGKSIDQLELHQSATLVAMLKGPSYYNPRRHPERAKARRNLVLNEMWEAGFLTEEEVQTASQLPLGIANQAKVSRSEYPGFMAQVSDDLSQLMGEAYVGQSGLRVFTTLDPIVQNLAEQSLAEQLTKLEKQKQIQAQHLQGAVFISQPMLGRIAAIVGGRDADFDGFNRALDAKRQVGSLIKPVVYLTALKNPSLYQLTSLLDDSKLELDIPGQSVWVPQNYDKKYHGLVPMWEALANSYNVPTVRLGLEVGLSNVVSTAQDLADEVELAPYASSVLGAQEMSLRHMAQIYSSIAAGGFRVELSSLIAVETADGQIRVPPMSAELAASAQATALIVHGLQAVMLEGTGRSLQHHLPAELKIAGKTGTTDNLRDSWFAGFNDDWLGVVWVGNDQNQPTKLTGASGALNIWGAIFSQVGLRAYEPKLPKGVKLHYVHRETGRRVSSRCENAIWLPFIVGSEPRKQLGCGGSRRTQKDDERGWFDRLFGR